MLPNEEFALACRAYYEEQGLIVDETNGQFAHCPLPKSMGDEGYYLLWGHHQQQGILQSRDVGRRCFFTPHVRKWLETVNYFPDHYFELWDIYEKFAKSSHLTSAEVRKKAIETRREKKNFNAGHLSLTKSVSKRAKTREKPVEITFPNGRVGVYPSLKFASFAVGVSACTLCRWVKQNRPVMGGSCQGYLVRHL